VAPLVNEGRLVEVNGTSMARTSCERRRLETAPSILYALDGVAPERCRAFLVQERVRDRELPSSRSLLLPSSRSLLLPSSRSLLLPSSRSLLLPSSRSLLHQKGEKGATPLADVRIVDQPFKLRSFVTLQHCCRFCRTFAPYQIGLGPVHYLPVKGRSLACQ
jgi:hypothetical protein